MTTTAEIWFDIACPWCYLGKRKWDAALAAFPRSEDIHTSWRSFELRPGHSTQPTRSLGEIMEGDWGLSSEQVEQIVDRLAVAGRAEGIELAPRSVHPVSTFDAHRLVHLATEHDLEDPVLESVFHAYHIARINIADTNLLTELGTEVGLARSELDALWGGDAFADAVRSDHARAADVGVTSIPSYRIASNDPTSGGLEVDELVSLLHERVPDNISRPAS